MESQPVVVPGMGVPTQEAFEQTAELDMREAEAYLDGIRRQWAGAGIGVRSDVTRGDPAAMILDTAGAADADLIVMTTHGRSGLSRLIYGSVAEAVLRASRTHVLLIPVKPAEGLRARIN